VRGLLQPAHAEEGEATPECARRVGEQDVPRGAGTGFGLCLALHVRDTVEGVSVVTSV
jgi:hypothetical protein